MHPSMGNYLNEFVRDKELKIVCNKTLFFIQPHVTFIFSVAHKL